MEFFLSPSPLVGRGSSLAMTGRGEKLSSPPASPQAERGDVACDDGERKGERNRINCKFKNNFRGCMIQEGIE